MSPDGLSYVFKSSNEDKVFMLSVIKYDSNKYEFNTEFYYKYNPDPNEIKSLDCEINDNKDLLILTHETNSTGNEDNNHENDQRKQVT